MKKCLLRLLVSNIIWLFLVRGELCGHCFKSTIPTDDYHCSGNVEVDFSELCAFLGMKDIPTVNTKQPTSSTHENVGEDSGKQEVLLI